MSQPHGANLIVLPTQTFVPQGAFRTSFELDHGKRRPREFLQRLQSTHAF